MCFKGILQNKTVLTLVLLIVLTIPTFFRMIKPGIFTMHDFHVFRLYEYDKCIADLQIPCRWAPDAAFGFGQPLFNFYQQLPYVFGEIFRFLGFSVIDSIKILFALSIVLSATAMFILAKQLWSNNLAAFLTALIYTYAPYRAVDVWVRGALPEALAFIFFPLLTYFFNEYILKRKTSSLLIFGFLAFVLINTHNLSALMYAIFLLYWGIYFIYKHSAWRVIPQFIGIGFLAIGLSSFYILPVVFESKFITLGKTTEGYYYFANHFLSLKQMLFSRYWGYGGSLWGDDDRLNLSVGHIQWLSSLVVITLAIFFKKIKNLDSFLVLTVIGWLMLFLTHVRAGPIWTTLPFITFIQFPWRFLGLGVFAFSLSSGAVVDMIKNKILKWVLVLAVIITVISLNVGFFREDIWLNFSDKEFFSGTFFNDQTASAVGDFWPIYGESTPAKVVDLLPSFLEGSGSARLLEKKSNKFLYELDIASNSAVVQFTMVYFPGWQGSVDGRSLDVYPSGKFGMVTTELKYGDKIVTFKFKNTPIRTAGDIISLISFLIFLILFFRFFRNEKA